MNAVLALPKFPERLMLDPPLSDEEFEKLCAANELIRMERTREGTIIVNPPTSASTSDGNSEIIYQLKAWWKQHRRGRVFDSSGGFFLPDGSSLSPDAAYATTDQLLEITKEDLNHFLHFAPAFVVELLSYTDNREKAAQKMALWVANGAKLGWLVDPYRKSVSIYEAGREVRIEAGDMVVGSGPVEGFVLSVQDIWERYEA